MKTLILTLVITLTSLNSLALAHEPASTVDTNETVKYWIMDTELK